MKANPLERLYNAPLRPGAERLRDNITKSLHSLVFCNDTAARLIPRPFGDSPGPFTETYQHGTMLFTEDYQMALYRSRTTIISDRRVKKTAKNGLWQQETVWDHQNVDTTLITEEWIEGAIAGGAAGLSNNILMKNVLEK